MERLGLDGYGYPRERLDVMTMARIAALQSTLGWLAPMASRPTVQHLADGGAVVFQEKQQKPKKPAKSQRVVMLTGEQFFDARMAACRAVADDVGENWHLVEGASYWGTIPPKMRRFVTARGSVCKAKPDARLPAPRYWPGGELPAGIVLSPDMPRDRTPAREVRRSEFSRKYERATRDYANARRHMQHTRARINGCGASMTWGGDYYRDQHRENVRAAWVARGDLMALRAASMAELERQIEAAA